MKKRKKRRKGRAGTIRAQDSVQTHMIIPAGEVERICMGFWVSLTLLWILTPPFLNGVILAKLLTFLLSELNKASRSVPETRRQCMLFSLSFPINVQVIYFLTGFITGFHMFLKPMNGIQNNLLLMQNFNATKQCMCSWSVSHFCLFDPYVILQLINSNLGPLSCSLDNWDK